MHVTIDMVVFYVTVTDQCSDYKQLLYPSCSGVDPNSLLKCNRTVLDIFSEASLCCKHSSEALSSGLTKRKTPYTQPRPVQKKPKAGAAKAVRKGGTMQTKVGPSIYLHICQTFPLGQTEIEGRS